MKHTRLVIGFGLAVALIVVQQAGAGAASATIIAESVSRTSSPVYTESEPTPSQDPSGSSTESPTPVTPTPVPTPAPTTPATPTPAPTEAPKAPSTPAPSTPAPTPPEPSPAAPAPSTEQVTDTSIPSSGVAVEVTGQLIYAEGHRLAQNATATPSEETNASAIVTTDGKVIGVSESSIPANAVSGSPIAGTVVVPPQALSELPAEEQSTVAAEAASASPSSTSGNAPVVSATSAAADIVADAAQTATAPVQFTAATVQGAPQAEAVNSTVSKSVDIVVESTVTANQWISSALINSYMAQLSAHWVREAHGLLTGITIRSVTVMQSAQTCETQGSNWFGMMSEAGQKVNGAAGTSPYFNGTGRHLIVITPNNECSANKGYSGMGTIGSSFQMGGLIEARTPASPRSTWLDAVFAHEMGHNLGLSHANAIDCGTANMAEGVVAAGSPCRVISYKDLYDIMGNTQEYTALNGFSQIKLGFLKENVGYKTWSAPGVYDVSLSSISSPSTTALQVLKVQDPLNPSWFYYVEYRSGTGSDLGQYPIAAGSTFRLPGSPATLNYREVAGVRVIRMASELSPQSNGTVALAPLVSGNERRQALVTGQSLTTMSGRIGVQVLSTDGSTAKVRISISLVPVQGSVSPFGSFEAAVASTGKVSVKGWAVDPTTSNPISVHVYVGSRVTPFTANVPRSDVGQAFPALGPNHGFAGDISGVSGTQQVCAYAISVAGGSNTTLGCKTVTIPVVKSPFGSLDSVVTSTGKVSVTGWAIDPNTSNPISVHVYVGSRVTPFTANVSRSDVGQAFPASGPNHGFAGDISGVSGTQQVCAYAISVAGGSNTTLGCKTVTIP